MQCATHQLRTCGHIILGLCDLLPAAVRATCHWAMEIIGATPEHRVRNGAVAGSTMPASTRSKLFSHSDVVLYLKQNRGQANG